MQITEPTVATLCQHHLLPGLGQVHDNRLLVLGQNLRADRQFQGFRLTAGTCSLLTHARVTILRLEMLLVAKIDKRIQMINHFYDHISAAAAIPAVRSAKFDILLAAERHAASTTIAALNINLCFVEKFHCSLPIGTSPPGRNKKGEWLTIPPEHRINAGASYAGGTTETLVRLRVL